jgi:hypothetical protein
MIKTNFFKIKCVFVVMDEMRGDIIRIHQMEKQENEIHESESKIMHSPIRN